MSNPSVTTVIGPSNGAYKAGTVLDYAVTFSEAVTVAGAPGIGLVIGSAAKSADYLSGSGTDTLVFRHVVAAGETDGNGIATGALALNGGTVHAVADDSDASLAFTAPDTTGVRVDTTAPMPFAVSTNAGSQTMPGDVVTVSISATEPVFVTGQPTLSMPTDTGTRTMTYAGGSGTGTLAFTFTVQPQDTLASLDYFTPGYVTSTTISLAGGTIADAAGNDVLLSLPDFFPPTVARVGSTAANGAYTTGAVIPIQVTFLEAVTVTGTPTLTLETGATDHQAVYVSGSGSRFVTFAYTVAAGDASGDLDYASTGALSLAGGHIVDGHGNAAVLTLAAPGATGSLGAAKAIQIDTAAPSITGADAPAAGFYATGQNLDVVVHFGEAVTVAGAPTVALGLDSGAATAGYLSGSGTDTLVFRHVVQAGDSDGDGIAVGAIALNGGSVHDAAGNDAALAFSAPDASGVRIASAGADSLQGTGAADTIDGSAGNDTLAAGGGRDVVHGGADNDLIYGGVGPTDPADGADTLYGDQGADTIYGNGGDDLIYGGAGPSDPTDVGDVIHGGGGNDTAYGNGGSDTIYGEGGQDVVHGGGDNDLLYGGAGPTDPADGADTLYGEGGSDTVYGNGGDDLIYGGTGVTDPGDGADTLSGGGGNDTIYGNGGNDTLGGDAGDDILFGGGGSNMLTGGAGADRLVITTGGTDTVADFHTAEGDKLDLQGQAYSAHGVSGGTQLDLSGGGHAILVGVQPQDVTTAFFV